MAQRLRCDRSTNTRRHTWREPAGFTPGPVNPQPFSAGIHVVPSYDVLDGLPPAAAERLRQLRQHVHDVHALTVPFDDIRDASEARTGAAQRLSRLQAHQQDGGFGLKPDDPRVTEQQRLVDRLNSDFQRLNERNEARTVAWRAASHTLSNVELWLRDGKPSGVLLLDYDGPEPQLLKNESISDAVERLRRRGRELKADLHRIRSAPFPASYCKAQMRAQIEALAMQGAPVVSDLIEHDRQIVWPTQRVQSSVYNAEPGAIAFAEVPDIALVAWLHKEALIVALDREIASEADDKGALSREARQKAEAEVLADLLCAERDESFFVWRAMDERLPAEHRADCAAEAILQTTSRVAPRVAASGTTPGYSWDLRR